jgi:hypothetical protein
MFRFCFAVSVPNLLRGIHPSIFPLRRMVVLHHHGWIYFVVMATSVGLALSLVCMSSQADGQVVPVAASSHAQYILVTLEKG